MGTWEDDGLCGDQSLLILQGVCFEGELAREEKTEENTAGPDICFGMEYSAECLRRHVILSPNNLSPLGFDTNCSTKIYYFYSHIR
jgi:hypothetical protein